VGRVYGGSGFLLENHDCETAKFPVLLQSLTKHIEPALHDRYASNVVPIDYE
jgi:hypothetical protein